MTASRDDLESQINYLKRIINDEKSLLNLIIAIPSVDPDEQASEVAEQERRIAYDEKRLAQRESALKELEG